MKIKYYNFRLICGRVFFLANGVLREADYANLKNPFVTTAFVEVKER